GLKGKIPYMSPEQCLAQDIDHRSDIFSLGINLYEATTGKHLFPQQNEFEALKTVVEGVIPPPSGIWPEYPPDLEEILRKALSKLPEDRYQSARELQIELEAFARRRGVGVTQLELASYMSS